MIFLALYLLPPTETHKIVKKRLGRRLFDVGCVIVLSGTTLISLVLFYSLTPYPIVQTLRRSAPVPSQIYATEFHAIAEEASASDDTGTHTFLMEISNTVLARLTNTQRQLIASMRSIAKELERDRLREFIADMFPSRNRFAKEICDLPSIRVDFQYFLNCRSTSIP